MAFANPDPDAIRVLLKSAKNIAVGGFSPRPIRPSHKIARQMQRLGFRTIPVRPRISEGLGEKAYRDLASVPDRIDLVNLFRNGKYAPQVIDECLRLGVKNLWMQEGCVNEEVARARPRRRHEGGDGPLHPARLHTAVRAMKQKFTVFKQVGIMFRVRRVGGADLADRVKGVGSSNLPVLTLCVETTA